jgi:hypothetical protein
VQKTSSEFGVIECLCRANATDRLKFETPNRATAFESRQVYSQTIVRQAFSPVSLVRNSFRIPQQTVTDRVAE